LDWAPQSPERSEQSEIREFERTAVSGCGCNYLRGSL
jgi:hypothetical protein